MFSYSGLSLTGGRYGCWFKFYCRYVLKLQGMPGQPLVFGKACHAVIEAAIKSGTTELPSLCNTVASASDLDPEEIKQCVDIPPVYAAIKANGEAEHYFEMPLDNTPFAPGLRGYIDYHSIGGSEVVLTDWKTNRAAYDPVETHQLGLYAAYLHKKYAMPVIGRLVFLRFNKTEEHEYTKSDMNEALEWARETAFECESRMQKVAMGDDPYEVFPRQSGPCEWCEYAFFCLSDIPQIPQFITSAKEALETADGILLAKEQIKLHENRLKAFLVKNGPVSNQRLDVRVNKTEYMKFDLAARKAVVAKMKDQNINIGSVLKIGSDAQDDLQTKYGWTEKDFLALGAKKGSTSRLSIEIKEGS